MNVTKVNGGDGTVRASDKEPPVYISRRMGLGEGPNAVTKGEKKTPSTVTLLPSAYIWLTNKRSDLCVFCEEPHPEAAPAGEKDFVVDPLYTFSVGGRNYS